MADDGQRVSTVVTQDMLTAFYRRLAEIGDGRLLTSEQVADIFGVEVRTVRTWALRARDGDPSGLPGMKASNNEGWRFTCEAVADFVPRHYRVPASAEA